MATEQRAEKGPGHHIRIPTPKQALRFAREHIAEEVLFTLVSVGAAGTLWFLHDRSPQTPPIQPTVGTSDSFKPDPDLSLGVVVSATSTVTASPSPEPTKAASPTTEPTKEIANDVPCDILPQEYCSKAEAIDFTGPTGVRATIIGFNLPENLPLLSPISGHVTAFELEKTPGDLNGLNIVVIDFDDPDVKYVISGDAKIAKNIPLKIDAKIEKGAILGYTQNTAGFENVGGYSIVTYILNGVGTGTTVDKNLMKQKYGEILDRPLKKISAPRAAMRQVPTRAFIDAPPK